MENSYGIGTRNRYELFLSEEDPLEILKAQEQEKEAKKKTKLNEKENRGKNEVPGKQAQAVRKGIKESLNIKTAEYSKAKEDTGKPKVVRTTNERVAKPAGESREERNNRRNREDRAAPTAEFGARDGARMDTASDFPRGRGGRGGGSRGVGRGRGRGRGGFDNRGKREFDRQSGSDKSGVKPMDKRDGAGAHNWGTYRDEIDDQMNSTHAAESQPEWSPEKNEPDAAAPEPNEPKDGATNVDPENQVTTDEGPQELTLDEWKALRGTRQKPTFNIRKAGEGEDLTQWKKMYALKKKEGEEEEEEEEEYDASEYPQRVGRQKHLLDIDIHFADSRRGTRGRGRGGMRGSGRPGRGGAGRMGSSRGGGPGSGIRGAAGGDTATNNLASSNGTDSPGRGPAQADGAPRNNAASSRVRQSAPKVDDENDFPSLG